MFFIKMSGVDFDTKQESLKTVETKNPANVAILREKLLAGEFDEDIFGANPRLTDDIKCILANPILSSIFIDALFIKCDSINTMRFWYDNSSIRMPTHPIDLALTLNSDLVVFEFLKEVGAFNSISKEKIKKVITIAENLQLPLEILSFLKNIQHISDKPIMTI